MTSIMKSILEKCKCKTSPFNGWYNITPELANEMLKLNICNARSYDSSTADAYAEDMEAGEWKANGETIVFSSDGVLRNGQHRLYGIVKSGKTVKIYIVFDADPQDFYDGGKNRTNRQRLKAYNTTVLSSAIARIVVQGGIATKRSGKAVVDKYTVENIEMIRKAESIVSTKGSAGKKAPCAAIVYGLLMNGEMSDIEMRNFFMVVNSGNTIGCVKEPSPALVLRKQLSEMRGGGQANQHKQFEITYKALRDFKFGNQRKRGYNDDSNDAERMIKEVYHMKENKRKAA